MNKNMDRHFSSRAAVAARRYVKERDYWLNKLSGQISKSCFPYDHESYLDTPGLNNEGSEQGTVGFGFSDPLFSRLMKLSRGVDHSLHMILQAVLILLLHKYNGGSDIFTGTTIYKQQSDAPFINMVLVLRNRVERGITFKELLLQVRETIIEAMENYCYPVEILAEQLNMPVTDDDFPLFDTALILQNIHDKAYLRHIPVNILFSFVAVGNVLEGVVEYNPALYHRDSIERFIHHFSHSLEQALSDPGLKIADISAMSGEEKYRLLVEFNETGSSYPADKTIQRLFEEQVEKTPGASAIVGTRGETLTYRQLNEEANRLAWLLRNKGAAPDTIVGIMMNPGAAMITGILGVLKAGSAYLPINPAAPQNRILAMLEDSRAPILLTQENCIKTLSFRALRGFECLDGKSFLAPPRAQVEDLDSLQIPDRSLIDYEKYRPNIGQAMVKNSITIHMSRGCAYNCAFCFKIWPKKYIIRSAENIFNEIHFYYKLGIRRFAFVDDLPNINLKVSSKVFELIIEHGLKVHLHFPNGIRGDILTPQYIDLMVAAGAITMDLALETTSPRLQRLIRKNLNLKKLAENIQYITQKHPHVILELQIIHGIPTETEEEARASLDFIKNIKWVHFPYIHILNIYPNSDMARIAIEKGISKEAIERSADLAYHELPETLPFPKSFTRQYQSEFLNDYFFSKERLLTVLPYQMKVLTEDELVQKYNSYLPMEITSFADLLGLAGISRREIEGDFLPADYGVVPGFNRKLRENFPQKKPGKDALNILLLDLSQYFTHDTRIMYDVVEPPLGLLYLLTHLDRTFGSKINGRIAKSRIDFDNYQELKEIIDHFKPRVIGIRTLNFYRDFFHRTTSLVRQWQPEIPIIAGGPYATSNYEYVLKDSAVDLVVIGEGEMTFAEVIGKILENGHRLPGREVLATIPGVAFAENRGGREIFLLDRLTDGVSKESSGNPPPLNAPSDLAYIIYTSGSTGIPKGVMVRHGNLVNQITGLRQKFNLNSTMNYLLLAAFTFDVSVMHIFSPLSTGARLYLIDEETRKDPVKLWQFVYEKHINILNIVPAYMKILLEHIEKRRIHLKYLFVGGDVFDAELHQGLRETFDVEHIINIYGPTETTINATLYHCKDVEKGGTIPIGKPVINYRVYVLDKYWQPLPIGAAGELCIAGFGVARGYLNHPELTREKFINYKLQITNDKQITNNKLQITNKHGKAAPHHSLFITHHSALLYKTGDLARWLPDGNIEFLARIDRQVKVRGFRIELGEIENQLLKHDRIKEAVVTARDSQGDRYLCAYLVVRGTADDSMSARTAGQSDGNLDAAELREYLSRTLPEHMIPAYFLLLEKIPLTTSGKPDLRALPGPESLQTGADYTAPRNEIEEKLVELWSDVLAVNEQVIGIDSNFFELGGHSLRATVLISRIHKQLDVNIPLVQLFKAPTIRGLSPFISEIVTTPFAAIEKAAAKPYYPVSSAQKRLYILQQMDRENTGYNLPSVLLLEGILDKERIKKVFRKLLLRHESLRTSFTMEYEEPVQKIHSPDDMEFEIEYYSAERRAQSAEGSATPTNKPQQTSFSHISSAAGEEGQSAEPVGANLVFARDAIEDFIRPFNLAQAPLFRVGFIEIGEERNIFMFDMHHIISDGTSLGIMSREFMGLYAGEELALLPVQYKDYTEWQNGDKQRESLSSQEEYWLGQFVGEIPVLNLPTDYPRPTVQSYAGRTLSFEIGREETAGLKKMARDQGATLYMVLLAVYNVLLSRLSGQEDIVLGTPTAGRRHASLEGVIGMFVNTLSIRNFPHGEKPFAVFLEEVKVLTLLAFDNQEYQFEDLVEKVDINRDASRNPLFDVMFALQNLDITEVKIPGLKLSAYEYENKTAKFDMTLLGTEVDEHLFFVVEYCTKLFKKATIERYIHYFKKVIVSLMRGPGKRLAEIELMTDGEKRQILFDFNDTGPEYPKDKTIHGLFEEQVIKTPGCTAVVFEGERVTYKELAERTDMLAGLLVKAGIRERNLVAIMVERSLEMITGILGILKAGCGYVPLNPRAPIDRAKYILAECGVTLLLTSRSLFEEGEKWRSLEVETIFIEECRGESMYSPDSSDQESRGEPCARPTLYSPDLSDQERRGESMYSPSSQPLNLSTSQLLSSSENLAYVIFTSGSTGKPKGVPITHANLSPFLHWGYSHLGIGSNDRTLQNLSYYFDWSVWEIFITLTTGASLYLAPDDVLLSPEICIDFMTVHQITVLHITPTQYQYMSGIDKKTTTLKYLFIGAEKLPYDLVDRSFALVNQDCRVFNMYGPTETTIISAVMEIDRKGYKDFAVLSSVPIGRPIGNTDLLVLDKSLKLCPVNVTGELYIGGDGLAYGYLNDINKSSQVFIENTFAGEGIKGDRLYKTGDLARWLPDGYVEFLGRVDHQVKIRGFRIEPGEIENHLLEHERVKEAVVIDRENEVGEKYLCAYIVAQNAELLVPGAEPAGAKPVFARDPGQGAGEVGGGDGPSPKELREYLSRSLPEYMIPAFFISLERIPINPNGKIDRKALPGPESVDLLSEDDYVPPRTKMEKKIALIWQDILGVAKIGIHDKFFDIGGNSLNIIRVGTKLNRELSIDVPVVIMFRFTTISALANFLEEQVNPKEKIKKPVDRSGTVNKAKARRLRKINKRRGVRNE